MSKEEIPSVKLHGLEDENSCDICMYEFKSDICIPRLLDCGHSLCTNCVSTLLQSTKICHMCRDKLLKTEAHLYPVNYKLLGEKFNSDEYEQVKKRLKKLSKNFDSVKESFSEEDTQKVEWRMATNESVKNLREECGNKVSSILDTNPEDLNRLETETLISDINEISKGMQNKDLSYRLLKNSVSIKYSSFKTPVLYLNEIYAKINKGHNIYALLLSEDILKVAKIDIIKNQWRLYMKNFQIYNKNDLPDGFLTVWFPDCMEVKWNAFLEVECNELGWSRIVPIETINSVLTTPFLHCCLGNYNSSYKGGYCKIPKVGSPANVQMNFYPIGNPASGNCEWFLPYDIDSVVKYNYEYYCYFFKSGTMRITKGLYPNNFVGMVAKNTFCINDDIDKNIKLETVDSGLFVNLTFVKCKK